MRRAGDELHLTGTGGVVAAFATAFESSAVGQAHAAAEGCLESGPGPPAIDCSQHPVEQSGKEKNSI